TVLLGISCIYLPASMPEKAFYIPEKERRLINRRQEDRARNLSSQELHVEDVKLAFLDWKVGLFVLANLVPIRYCMDFPHSRHRQTMYQTVQTLTIPCYTLGALGYLGIAWPSDRQQRRSVYTCSIGIVSVVG